MKIKPINKFLSFFLAKDVIAITLAPFGIYISNAWIVSRSVQNHESIHWKQQIEMGIIFFYLWYVVEWLIKLLVHGKTAYWHLSFEREANENEANLTYLANRKPYTWIRYLWE